MCVYYAFINKTINAKTAPTTSSFCCKEKKKKPETYYNLLSIFQIRYAFFVFFFFFYTNINAHIINMRGVKEGVWYVRQCFKVNSLVQ